MPSETLFGTPSKLEPRRRYAKLETKPLLHDTKPESYHYENFQILFIFRYSHFDYDTCQLYSALVTKLAPQIG